jgi:predicted deacylase
MLKTFIIEGGQASPQVVMTAGVHGDEFPPMAALRTLAREIDPARLRGRLTLVPVVNEPAFQRGARTAEDGRDLARTCPGRDNGTITEQIACSLSQLIRTADYYIDLHTGGARLRVTPLAGYMLHPDPTVLATQRRMARACGFPLVWGTDPTLEGRSLSVARDANIPAIYTEYLGGTACAASDVEACARACRNVLIELGLLDGVPPRFSPLVVEDPRPGSGHMQVCYPSPADGLFEPAAALGQPVRAGDLLGTVTDMRGDAIHSIVARQTGLLIVLHTLSRIESGMSVGVILETNARLGESEP